MFFIRTLQELATEIILTLGQAFEIAYQMALQEQQQSKQEAAEGATADPTPRPPPEGAGVAGVTTTSQPDGSRGNNSQDKQTEDVNSEIDDITQGVTNTHIHKSAEPACGNDATIGNERRRNNNNNNDSDDDEFQERTRKLSGFIQNE